MCCNLFVPALESQQTATPRRMEEHAYPSYLLAKRKPSGLLWQPIIPEGSRAFPWANLARANLSRAKIIVHLAAHEVRDSSPFPCVFLED